MSGSIDITEAQIQQFFDRSCTEEEADMVADYLLHYPVVWDNRLREEWKADPAEGLTEAESSVLYGRLERGIFHRPARIKKLTKALALAASLILLLVSIRLLMTPKEAANTGNLASAGKEMKWQLLINTTTHIVRDTLADGTIAWMERGASLQFPDFKILPKRDVRMNGTVTYAVAHDATKPFTVFASGITTTALGTKFTVQEDAERVSVKLYEGKVVIRSIDKAKQPIAGDVFLKPGQEFEYNLHTKAYHVRPIPAGNTHKSDAAADALPTVQWSGLPGSNWFMFNNQALPVVFEQLQEIFNVKIQYNPDDFRKVYFIGKFEKTDSVGAILGNIVLLKRLHLKHQGNTYYITRK